MHLITSVARVKFWQALFVLILATQFYGCAHHVSFQELHYEVATEQSPTTLVAVIDQGTMQQAVPIKSWATGIAHSWDAYPGEMLKQVVDIEFPQTYRHYRFSHTASALETKQDALIVVMTVPNYEFKDFHAYFSVRTQVYDEDMVLVHDRRYDSEGKRQGSKMVWGGAFGMKSAMRQSSLDALQTIFKEIRADLRKTSRGTIAE